MSKRAIAPLLTVFALACAHRQPQSAGGTLDRITTDGSTPLALRLVSADGGESAAFERVAESDADLLIALKHKGGYTTAVLRNNTGKLLKLDMEISPDGHRFNYTSSCAVIPHGQSFELWAGELQLAVSKPRFVGREYRGRCD